MTASRKKPSSKTKHWKKRDDSFPEDSNSSYTSQSPAVREAINEDTAIIHPEQNDRLLVQVFFGAVLVFAGLTLYAGFFPTGLNWGYHHAGFLPRPIKIIIPLMMAFLIVPSIREKLFTWCCQVAEFIERKSASEKFIVVAAMLGISALVFWIARERTFLLGDGNMIVRTVRRMTISDDIPRFFRYEPLAGFLMWKISLLFERWGMVPYEEFPLQVLNTLCGVGSVLFLTYLVREIAEKEIDQVLLFGFVAVAGSAELCFGYVEDYPPLYFALMLYLWLGTAAIKGKLHPAIPSAVFSILLTLHFAMIVMAPSLLFVWYYTFRQSGWKTLVLSLCATFCVASAVLIFLCGYSPDVAFSVFLTSREHLLHPNTPASDSQAYTFFSAAHALDLVNLEVLLVPFGVLSLVLLLFFRRAIFKKTDRVFLFLITIALGGLGFTTIFNFDLGMSRDWDLLASFHVGLCVVAGYAWQHARVLPALSRRLFLVMMMATFLHTVCWVSVNATEEKAVARFSQLPNPTLWGRRSILAAYEELAIFYRGKQDAQHAIQWYDKFLTIDSTNPRIWSAIANVYYLVGDKEHEMHCDEKAVQLGSTIWDTYLNLGVYYFEQGRYEESEELLRKALELNPQSAEATFNLGSVYVKAKKDYRTAAVLFDRTLELEPDNLDALYASGFCLKHLGKVFEMQHRWRQYLERDPSSQRSAIVQQFLDESLARRH